MPNFGMSEEHKTALRKNRVALTDDLIVDERFLAVLIQHNMLPSGQKEKIDYIDLPSKRARWAIDYIQTKGPNAMKVFIDSLMETSQAYLAERLDKALADQWRQNHPEQVIPVEPPIVPKPSTTRPVDIGIDITSDDVDALVTNDFTHIDRDLIERDEAKHIMTKENFTTNNKNAYKIGQGRLFIINNHRYNVNDPSFPEITLQNRTYSAIDFTNLNVMEEFNFEVKSLENIDKQRITQVLGEEIKFIKDNHSTIDCYMFVMLSYGTQHDLTMVDGERLNPERIIKRFSDQVSELVNKPKIFIFHTDHVSVVPGEVTDHVESGDSGEVFDGPSSSELNQPAAGSIHPEANFYCVTSKAYIKEEKNQDVPWYAEGSLFIRLFTHIIAKYAHKEHIKEMVLRACALMNAARQKHGQKLSHVTKLDKMKLEPYLFAKESFF